MNKFGGNVYQQDLNAIFSNTARKYQLNYSHKKENRWNMWMQDSGLTLSFVLNNGLFIPSLSGIEKRTLEKFYSSCASDVHGWVQHHTKTYFEVLKARLEQAQSIEDAIREHREEHEEFLTPEEIASMYPEPVVEETQQLVLKKKRKRARDKQVPGQLSIFDLYGDL